MKLGTFLVSMALTVSSYAGYDVEFLHNEHSSGYVVVVTDDYGHKVFVPVSEKEFLKATEHPELVDVLVRRIKAEVKPLPY